MNQHTKIKEIEKKVRKSYVYNEWVKRNKQSLCVKCSDESNLELHHIVELHTIIYGLWKFYNNWAKNVCEDVYQHTMQLHERDMCECATICNTCHGEIHPKRKQLIYEQPEVRKDEWCLIPRNYKYQFNYSKAYRNGGEINYIAFQTLFGIGWHIYQGSMVNRIITIKRFRFGKLLGKKRPGSQFNKSLENALEQLYICKIIDNYDFGETTTIQISKDYLNAINKQPWWISLEDLKTSNNMSILTLKWWLSFTNNRRTYKIGIKKFANHLNYKSPSNSSLVKTIKKSVSLIKWVDISIENEMFIFTQQNRKAVPIYTLRQLLIELNFNN